MAGKQVSTLYPMPVLSWRAPCCLLSCKLAFIALLCATKLTSLGSHVLEIVLLVVFAGVLKKLVDASFLQSRLCRDFESSISLVAIEPFKKMTLTCRHFW